MRVVYGMPSEQNEADIYFFDSYIVGKGIGAKACAMHQAILRFSPLVMLCSGAGPLNQLKNEKFRGKMVHLRHPLGPKKLANTMLSALKVGKIDLIKELGKYNKENAKPVMVEKVSEKEPSTTQVKEVKEELPSHPKGLEPASTPRSRSRSPRPEPKPIQDHQPVVPAHINSISSPAVLTGGAARQTQHLLLVDDNPINLKILTTLVKKLNHTFETASNGLEAVQLYKASLIQNHQFDFVFMDISMPVMNGFEATREIRRFEKDEKVGCAARIAALTGLGSEMSKQEAFASGTNLFLTKPVKLGEIKKLLEHEQVRGQDAVGG